MVHFRNFSSLAHAKMTLVKFKDFCVKLNLEIIFSQDKKIFLQSIPYDVTLGYTLTMMKTPYLARLLKSSC